VVWAVCGHRQGDRVGLAGGSTAVLQFCILNHHCVVNTGTVTIVFCDGRASEIVLCYKESLRFSRLAAYV
jgi:hypothetical protein